MSDRRAEYFRQLGFDDVRLDKEDDPNSHFVSRALARAYSLRSFEIEHHWKRATYFWGYQIAIFAALGFVAKSDFSSDFAPLVFVLPLLGTLTALANALVAAGSKFWQENWEKHIDMLEDNVEGKLHKTVWNKNNTLSYSVSRVNLVLAWIFVGFWGFLSAYECVIFLTNFACVAPQVVFILAFLVILALFGFALWQLLKQKTNFRADQSNWHFIPRVPPGETRN